MIIPANNWIMEIGSFRMMNADIAPNKEDVENITTVFIEPIILNEDKNKMRDNPMLKNPTNKI